MFNTSGKTAGPEGVPPVSSRPAQTSTDIFNASLQSVVPVCFKKTTIVLLPKNTKVTGLNDYCPVASTPIAIKCLEKLVVTHINSIIPNSSDPLHTYVRRLFIDFSSVFNTIVPSKLILKLRDLGLGTPVYDHSFPVKNPIKAWNVALWQHRLAIVNWT